MKVPKAIEEMEVLFYTETGPHRQRLSRYMNPVPDRWVIVREPEANDICILGTDTEFNNWDRYSNYVFKELREAFEAPQIIFKLDDIHWKKP